MTKRTKANANTCMSSKSDFGMSMSSRAQSERETGRLRETEIEDRKCSLSQIENLKETMRC